VRVVLPRHPRYPCGDGLDLAQRFGSPRLGTLVAVRGIRDAVEAHGVDVAPPFGSPLRRVQRDLDGRDQPLARLLHRSKLAALTCVEFLLNASFLFCLCCQSVLVITMLMNRVCEPRAGSLLVKELQPELTHDVLEYVEPGLNAICASCSQNHHEQVRTLQAT